MVSFTPEQLYAWIGAFLWPLARVLGLLGAAPILGNAAVPLRVKVGLGVLITLVIAPVLGPMPAVAPFSGEGALLLVQQTLIGLAMGFAVRIAFVAFDMAGELIGLQMGLGFATLFDPQNAAQTQVLSQFFGLVATLLFLSINGHLVLVTALAESFRVLPVAGGLGAGGFGELARWGGQIFLIGVVLSLPLMAALLIGNLALGVLTRAAPQLNIFAVGFPLTLALGLVCLLVALPFVVPGMTETLGQALQKALAFAAAARP